MKRFDFRWIRSRPAQFILLVSLAVVAIAIWATRTSTPTVVIGERTVSQITDEIAEGIGDKHGELCEEYGTSDFVGEYVDTGLTASSSTPAAAASFVQRGGRTIDDYRHRQLDSDRIVLVFRAANDQLPADSTVLAHAVELRLFVNVAPDGTVASQPEWVETESSAIYPCD